MAKFSSCWIFGSHNTFMRPLFHQLRNFVQKRALHLLSGGLLSIALLQITGTLQIAHAGVPIAAVPTNTVPIAQEQRSLGLAERAFRGQFGNRASRPSNTLILIVAGSVLAVLILSLILGDRYYRRFKIKDGYYNRNSLFREICQAHRFTKYQQRLLKDIAKMLHLENPLDLFIEPKYLQTIIAKHSKEFPLEALRNIFTELFNDGGVVKETGISKAHDSWFPVTRVSKNPNAQELVYSKGTGTKAGTPNTTVNIATQDMETTRFWDPAFWDEINLIGNGLSTGANTGPTQTSTQSQIAAKESISRETTTDYNRPPVYVAPPLKSDVEEMQSQTYHQPTAEEQQKTWNSSKK